MIDERFVRFGLDPRWICCENTIHESIRQHFPNVSDRRKKEMAAEAARYSNLAQEVASRRYFWRGAEHILKVVDGDLDDCSLAKDFLGIGPEQRDQAPKKKRQRLRWLMRHLIQRIFGFSDDNARKYVTSLGSFNTTRFFETHELGKRHDARHNRVQRIPSDFYWKVALFTGQPQERFTMPAHSNAANSAARLLQLRFNGVSGKGPSPKDIQQVNLDYPSLEFKGKTGPSGREQQEKQYAKMTLYGLCLLENSQFHFARKEATDHGISKMVFARAMWSAFSSAEWVFGNDTINADPEKQLRIQTQIRTSTIEVSEKVGKALCGEPPFDRKIDQHEEGHLLDESEG
jgi:hypothetical protein